MPYTSSAIVARNGSSSCRQSAPSRSRSCVAPTGVPSATSSKSCPIRRSVTNRQESLICWEVADAFTPMPEVRYSARPSTSRRSSIHA